MTISPLALHHSSTSQLALALSHSLVCLDGCLAGWLAGYQTQEIYTMIAILESMDAVLVLNIEENVDLFSHVVSNL